MGEPAKEESTDWTSLTNNDDQLREAINNENLAINLLMNNEQEYAETFVLLCHEYEMQFANVQEHAADTRQAESVVHTHVQPIRKEHPNQEKHFKDLGTGSVALDVAIEKHSMCADGVRETSLQATLFKGKVAEYPIPVKQDPVQDEKDPIQSEQVPFQDKQPYHQLEDDQSLKDHSGAVQTTKYTCAKVETLNPTYQIPYSDIQTIPNSEAQEVAKLDVQNGLSFNAQGQPVEGDHDCDNDVLAVAQILNHIDMNIGHHKKELLPSEDHVADKPSMIDVVEEPIVEEPAVEDLHSQVFHNPLNGDDHELDSQAFKSFNIKACHYSMNQHAPENENEYIIEGCVERVALEEDQYDSTTERNTERDGRHSVPQTLDDFKVLDQYYCTTKRHAEKDGSDSETLKEFKVERASAGPSHLDIEEYRSDLGHEETASGNPSFEREIPGWPNPVMERIFGGLRHSEVPVFAFADIVARNGAEHEPEYFVSEARSAEATFDDRDAFGDSHAERQGSEDPDAKIHRICNVKSVHNSDPIERQTLEGIDREKQPISGLGTEQDIGCCDPSASYREQDPDPNNAQLEHHDPMPFPPPLLNIYQYESDDIPYSIEVQDDDDDEFINLHPHHDNNPK